MKTLLVATTNPKKLAELREIFAGLGVQVVDLRDAGADQAPEAVEDGATFEDNAIIKARHYAALTGRVCLADDSGLEVDALGGAPGVYSARYAEREAAASPPTSTSTATTIAVGTRQGAAGEVHDTRTTRETRDAANNALLLSRLARVVDPAERRARFVCVMALARRDGTVLHTSRGTLEGVIAEGPRGQGGFGYDPIVHLPDIDRRVAELTSDEKHARSHRGHAGRAMAAWLESHPAVFER